MPSLYTKCVEICEQHLDALECKLCQSSQTRESIVESSTVLLLNVLLNTVCMVDEEGKFPELDPSDKNGMYNTVWKTINTHSERLMRRSLFADNLENSLAEYYGDSSSSSSSSMLPSAAAHRIRAVIASADVDDCVVRIVEAVVKRVIGKPGFVETLFDFERGDESEDEEDEEDEGEEEESGEENGEDEESEDEESGEEESEDEESGEEEDGEESDGTSDDDDSSSDDSGEQEEEEEEGEDEEDKDEEEENREQKRRKLDIGEQ